MPPRLSTTARAAPAAALTRPVAWRVFWRCLTLQASWNEQRMQNLGLLAALAPWFKRQNMPPQLLRSVCRRYYGYFNTNPYLAGYVVGGLLHLEQARERGAAVDDRQVGRLRDTLARACGALGDQIFWLGMRPALMLAGCLSGLWGRWDLVLLLVGGFAASQLWWRWRSLVAGFALGAQVIDVIGRPAWHRTIAWTRRAALALTGVVVGVYFASIAGPGETVGSVRLLGLLCLGLGLPLLVRQQISAELQLLLGFVCVQLVILVLA